MSLMSTQNNLLLFEFVKQNSLNSTVSINRSRPLQTFNCNQSINSMRTRQDHTETDLRARHFGDFK